MILLALALSGFSRQSWVRRGRVWLTLLGAVLVILSATPLPLMIYLGLAAATVT